MIVLELYLSIRPIVNNIVFYALKFVKRIHLTLNDLIINNNKLKSGRKLSEVVDSFMASIVVRFSWAYNYFQTH